MHLLIPSLALMLIALGSQAAVQEPRSLALDQMASASSQARNSSYETSSNILLAQGPRGPGGPDEGPYDFRGPGGPYPYPPGGPRGPGGPGFYPGPGPGPGPGPRPAPPPDPGPAGIIPHILPLLLPPPRP